MRKNFNEENENLKKKFDELFEEKISEIKFVDNLGKDRGVEN
jgi:hypothetical protein